MAIKYLTCVVVRSIPYRQKFLKISIPLTAPLSPPLVVYETVEYDRNDGGAARALPFLNLPYESEPENCVIKKLSFSLEFTATFTCDDKMEIFADGQSLGTDSNWANPTTYHVSGNTRVLSVAGKNTGGIDFGILGSTSNGLVTNETWKCSSVLYPEWNSPNFDHQSWPLAEVIANHGDSPWGTRHGIPVTAKWIWGDTNSNTAYCRLTLQ